LTERQGQGSHGYDQSQSIAREYGRDVAHFIMSELHWDRAKNHLTLDYLLD